MNTHQTLFERIALYIAVATAFLVPIIVIPSASVPVDATKMLILALGTLLALAALIVSRIQARSFSIVRDGLIYTVALIPVAFVISAFLSGATSKSLIAQGTELGTVSTVALFFVLAWVVSAVASTKEKALYFYTAFFVPAVLIALFHISRFLFGVKFLALGMFTSTTSNVIGSWNDLGVYFALIALLILVTLTTLTFGRLFKTVLYVLGVLSLFIAVCVNFTTLWYVLAVAVALFGWYEWNVERKVHGPKKALKKIILPAIILVVALIAINSADTIGKKVTDTLQTNQVDVRPSWQLTFDIAYQTLRDRPFFGSGPNTFTQQYLSFKPQAINNTVFWSVDFPTAVGYLPTFATTGGLVALILWVILFTYFAKKGSKVFREPAADIFTRYILNSSFLAASFLLIMAVLAAPSVVILTLLAVFMGIFLTTYYRHYPMKHVTLAWADKGVRMILISILGGIIVLAVLAWAVVYVGRFAAANDLQKALISLNAGTDTQAAEALLMSAAKWSPTENYYQALSELQVVKINRLIAATKTADDKFAADLQAILAVALRYGQSAVLYDPNNYQNYVEYAHISETVVPLQVKDSYETAKAAYTEAIKRNPLNPALYLALAQLEVSHKNLPEAKKYVGAALQAKNNYTDAIFLLAQIQVNEGDIKNAIISAQAIVQLDPNNPTGYFQLGLLQYNDKNYTAAIEALEKAVTLSPQYSNARYFLGLSYARVNRMADAITQFAEVKKTNPDNQEVATILQNLQSGKSPFTDVKPPADNKPEKRKKLPVKDNVDKTATTQVNTH